VFCFRAAGRRIGFLHGGGGGGGLFEMVVVLVV